jgi:hypothetical protein
MGNNPGKPVVFTDDGTSLLALIRPQSLRLAPDRHQLFLHPLATNVPPLVNLNHFRLLRVVGKGAFGKVRIVERKDTGLTFALKYIRKDEGTSYPLRRRATTLTPGRHSYSIRECAEHNQGATDAGASEPPIHLQSAIQLSRH